MLFKKEEKSPETFWREYEEKTGEKVLSRGLGKYISGWDEFDKYRRNGLWGLIINTTGGFRFHHFPQKNIFDALFQFTFSDDKEPPKEKTIFLPREKITSQTFIKEEKWWKRIISGSAPRLVISYTDEEEKKLIFEVDYTKEGIS